MGHFWCEQVSERVCSVWPSVQRVLRSCSQLPGSSRADVMASNARLRRMGSQSQFAVISQNWHQPSRSAAGEHSKPFRWIGITHIVRTMMWHRILTKPEESLHGKKGPSGRWPRVRLSYTYEPPALGRP